MIKLKKEEINCDERNLISIAYKNYINEIRNSIKISYEKKEIQDKNSLYLNYKKEYKKKIIKELEKECVKVFNNSDRE